LDRAGRLLLGNGSAAQAAHAAEHSNPPVDLRFRQVHLDFHSSADVTDIAAHFDPDEFAETLKRAHVDSVTCFARCHHGYIYYDTKKNPERKHPHLKRKHLLEEQIEACHKRGIRVPIYTTIQWDAFSADEHPEWRQVTETGTLQGTPPYEPGFYRFMCLNPASPYLQFLRGHLEDLFASVPVDGLFLDITHARECSCPLCRRDMRALGLDAAKAADRLAFARQTLARYIADTTALIRGKSRDCTIFYNGGHVNPDLRPNVLGYSHLELESLPSGGWGYLHFPMTMRYARNLGVDCLGMTGKFHTSWGDFQSYKNEAALQFEVFNMLALGAKCSIGDQLPPQGRLDPATYALIGSVYAEVEKKEPWCRGARGLSDIGVLSPEEFQVGRQNPSALGVVRILQEGHHQFDIVDSKGDLGPYRLLILPDFIPLSPALAAKVDAFVAKGGALLATYKSGLNEKEDAFATSAFGVRYKGDAPFSPDFLAPKGALAAGLPGAEYVVYKKGLEVEPLPGSEVLVQTNVPYFNRTWEHYFSHRHTPSTGKPGYPGVVRNGRAVYFMHPLFAQYQQNAPRWCKQIVLNAVSLLLAEPLVRTSLPSAGLVSVNEQTRERRYVVHLLHYVPERRGLDFDVVEDVVPLLGVRVSLRVPRRVRGVLTAPQGARLAFTEKAGRVEFTLPRLEGHQMVAVAWV
ncbi:MAG TPA: alpha-amylase family protein, partial [Vicinamibacteria bacterium]